MGCSIFVLQWGSCLGGGCEIVHLTHIWVPLTEGMWGIVGSSPLFVAPPTHLQRILGAALQPE